MNFKDKVKILTDRGQFKEIKGNIIPYKDKSLNIELLVHISENAWTPDTVDVSEKSTGCRLFSMTNLEPKVIKPADVVEATANFIKEKGKKVFIQQIENQILSHPEIYNRVDK